MSGDDWFSDEALRKQREALACKERGEPVPLSLLFGIMEPRVPATDDERCSGCRSDARAQAGGAIIGPARWCGLCISRRRYQA